MFDTLNDKKVNNEMYSRLLTVLNGNKKCCFGGHAVIMTKAVSMHRYNINTKGEQEIDEISFICDACANKITKSNLNNIRERCYAHNLYPVMNEEGITLFFEDKKEIVETRSDSEMSVDMKRNKEYKIIAPKQIKELLDEYVIGQEKLKKVLSVAVYNHYKRFLCEKSHIEKSNILLIGPTGSGKTLLVSALSKILDVPMITIDATELTPAGFKGADVDTIIHAGHVRDREHIKGRLAKYGLIPEFIGRFPVYVNLEALSVEQLVRILKESKDNIINQYKTLMAMDNKKLIIKDDGIQKSAEKAYEQKNGARGLRLILEEIMLDIIYEMPSQEHVAACIITKETVVDGMTEYIFNWEDKTDVSEFVVCL